MRTHDQAPTTGNNRRKKIIKILSCVTVAVAMITLITIIFVISIRRIRCPELHLASVTVENLRTNFSSSFAAKLHAQVTLKNANMGYFKYGNGNVTFSYRINELGHGVIRGDHVEAFSSKEMALIVEVSSEKVNMDSEFGSDLDSGIVRITCNIKLNGKVHLFNSIIEKKRTARMDCAMDVNVVTKNIQNLKCNQVKLG